ncbi:MAG: hypothetical protein J6T08_01130 [Lentisphaeria bacterium]|nr:hypothetical protein [Lentisphaeria bacterium]
MNKTCRECCGFSGSENRCLLLGGKGKAYADNEACRRFVEKKTKAITNGDKIIAGGMRAIAKFALHHCCNNCIYFDGNNPYRSTCGKPDNETCEDGVEAWLNAPAESEGKYES